VSLAASYPDIGYLAIPRVPRAKQACAGEPAHGNVGLGALTVPHVHEKAATLR